PGGGMRQKPGLHAALASATDHRELRRRSVEAPVPMKPLARADVLVVMSQERRVGLRGGKRWPYLLSLTIVAGFWTTFMFAVGFALAGESNRTLPLGYYVLQFGGLLLAGAVAFWITRRSGRGVGRSLLTAFHLVVASFFIPFVAITVVIIASGG